MLNMQTGDARKRQALQAALALTILVGYACRADVPGGDASLERAAMSARYVGGYLPSLACWIYTDPTYGRYCVRPAQSAWIERSALRQLYLLTAGEPLRADDRIDELPAHALPGLVGAFAVTQGSSGKAEFLAASDAFLFGSFGDAGARAARLTRIGAPDTYAWIFSSGGTWQGITVGRYHILTPRGHRFVDLSTVPVVREGDQAHRYTLSYQTATSVGRIFPLTVTERTDPGGAEVAHFVLPFNYHTWQYEFSPESSPH